MTATSLTEAFTRVDKERAVRQRQQAQQAQEGAACRISPGWEAV